MTKVRKKLIEVALPLEAINSASAREKSIRRGHPNMLHLWWARRPLAAARAVIFTQMVDDPSSHPELFPTEAKQNKERERLFDLVSRLVEWEGTTNELIVQQAQDEIWKSWRATCGDNRDDLQVEELFDAEKLPAFHDPFAGGGALPLEAQRLGLEAYASDLNPVAVLINKMMIEIPPKFAGQPPVNPDIRKNKTLFQRKWHGAEGLAEDVRYYGRWMRDESERRIGKLYPKVLVTSELANHRKDLEPLVGRELTVIAWLWARTVKSPNPAFAQVDVPLVSTFMLSSRPGREAYVQPIIEGSDYCFMVKMGHPKQAEVVASGTKLTRANFRCLMSGTPIPGDYIKAEGQAKRMGTRLIAVVAEAENGRVYLSPTKGMEEVANMAHPAWKPDVVISGSTQYLGVKPYGMEQFSQLFTDRQLVALSTFSDLVSETMERVKQDVLSLGSLDEGMTPDKDEMTASSYASAVSAYLALAVDKLADYNSALVLWSPTRDQIKTTFSRQALQMAWDFAETNTFAGAAGDLNVSIEGISRALERLGNGCAGYAISCGAQNQTISRGKVISTDPPYYDNVPYADLSDFFYVWLRRSLRGAFPELFSTVAVPKAEELVAFAYRHKSKDAASAFFLDGMTQAMHRLSEHAHPAFPITIYYAFKQAETDGEAGTASTGWETFLDAVIRAGMTISGTWPMRTEREARSRGQESNALASSIVLVCRPRSAEAISTTRREFVTALKNELPSALNHLQRGNIAPVDLAQAAIGPGMAVYTRYSTVLDASGKPLTVRDALTLINQTLDEVLAEQEGDFDADTRWALAWFEESGFSEGEYDEALKLSRAKNTSVPGMADAGILKSKSGKVRLLRPDELSGNWDPTRDPRLTAWESVHQLIRVLQSDGERAAADLVAKIGSKAEIARELAYRLYVLSERKKRAQEALSYNGLVQSWPEILRLSRESGAPRKTQTGLFQESEE